MPKIKLKRGLEEKLPVLDEGEPGFTTDSGKFFIGSSMGNVEIAKKEDLNGLPDRIGVLETGKADKSYVDSDKAKKLDAASTLTYYVSTTGSDTNNGLTASTPFQTLQKAFDTIRNTYNVIDGTIKIDIAAGTYEQSASIADVKSKNRIQIIGKKDLSGIPTVIFEGGNNAALPYAMSFSGYMQVLVQDVKVQNYGSSVSRSGIVGQLYVNIWTRNVHASNCGFAGINMDIFCRLYVEGGIIENCRIGIRVYSNSVCTIGYNNPTSSYTDPNHTIVRNCTETGILIYNMSTGHLDFTEINGNVTGVTIQNSSRLHVWQNLIKNNTLYGVLVGTGSTWYDDANTYTGNAKDYKRGAFSNELNENEYYTPIMKISPTVCIDKTTLTGSTTETYFNTLTAAMKHTLTANTFVTKGQKLKIIVTGSFTGANTKTVNLRLGTTLIAGFTSVSGSTKNFCLEVDYFALSATAQKVFSKWIEGNSAYNALYTDRTAGLSGGPFDITVTGTLADPTASIVVETFEVREIA
jgi:hypothetical protein